MARGRGGIHKGGRRHFTNPDDLKQKEEKERKEREWKRRAGGAETESDEEEEDEESSEEESGSEEGSSSENEDGKAKGVDGLIEIENPNRVVKKVNKKALEQIPGSAGPSSSRTAASGSDAKTAGPELSRREREEVEKQRARENYDKMHAAGKTEQARADLARLALIRQQREDAAKKRGTEPAKPATAGAKSTGATTVSGPAPTKKVPKK
ncbi:28 kDa heat- and acid-stable phosphoprotein [Halotydeus destructor]|nr:28 kDa heat- and acid-stable phosphoprotein [Halotydeus destructor]